MPQNLPINIGWTMRETEEKRGRKPREKEKARRRRRRRRSMKEGQGNEDGGGKEEDDEEEEGRDEEDDGRVLGVFVHHSDYLPIGDQNILHPNVKVISTMLCVVAFLVHFLSQVLLVNLADGGHVRKSNSSTNASYAQESDSNVTHILPLMTQPFNFRY